MKRFYLSSAALINEHFDGLKTIEEAVKHGFDGVQLFLDTRYREREYLKKIFNKLDLYPNLGLLIHLPNEPLEIDIFTVKVIYKQYPLTKFLVHYEPLIILPLKNKVPISWENSVSKVFDPKTIEIPLNQSRKDRTGFVFDYARIAFSQNNNIKEQALIIEYIKHVISLLDPDTDILHAVDKTQWDKGARDGWAACGSGILKDLKQNLKNYSGIIVFEHEDLNLQIESFKNLRD
jgi:sugar phosphate isomerase/epimerase